MKISKRIIISICLITLISGCENAELQANTDEKINPTIETTAEALEINDEKETAVNLSSSVIQPFDNASFGEQLSDYDNLCSPLLSGIPYELISKVGADEFEKWVSSFNSKELPTDIADCENLYSFICHFNADNDTVREILTTEQKIWQENGIYPNYTDEQIEIILSMNKDIIAETFVNETAIYSNGEIFTPKWLYNISTDKWKDKNIPAQQLYEKASLILEKLPFSKEGAAYFSEKCGEYCGKSIPVPDQSNINTDTNNDVSILIEGTEELIGENDFDPYRYTCPNECDSIDKSLDCEEILLDRAEKLKNLLINYYRPGADECAYKVSENMQIESLNCSGRKVISDDFKTYAEFKTKFSDHIYEEYIDVINYYDDRGFRESEGELYFISGTSGGPRGTGETWYIGFDVEDDRIIGHFAELQYDVGSDEPISAEYLNDENNYDFYDIIIQNIDGSYVLTNCVNGNGWQHFLEHGWCYNSGIADRTLITNEKVKPKA